MREQWGDFSCKYLIERPNLMCLFQLIDCRIEPQAIDLSFSNFLGKEKIPFVLAFTKSDKVTTNILNKNISAYSREMSKTWEELPRQFITSSNNKKGREELLAFIQQTNLLFNRQGRNP
jgi:GTP-binding protein